jgi:acetyl-CoA carboxylase biotin carboxylase subunit
VFNRVLIANRGEIAVRVIRALHELGIEAVAVYSTADEGALHTRLADRAVCIGPAPPGESYLRIPSVIAAATTTRCDAIHPGYGFLSENPAFVEACLDNELVFVGPSAETMARMATRRPPSRRWSPRESRSFPARKAPRRSTRRAPPRRRPATRFS